MGKTTWRASPWVYGVGAAGIIGVAVVLLLAEGRTPWGPSGSPGLWEGDIWSPENSQRLADPYTFTHLLHGAGFYGFFRLLAPGLPLGMRGVVTVIAESAWEVFENSDAVIARYRAGTVSQDYQGDSVLNSVGDILACVLGFLLASRFPARVTVIGALLLEGALALWVRDGLVLNILMLIHPINAVRTWQLGG